MSENRYPESIELCEVAPRDGFQAEDEWIPTEKKIEIIRKLADTGVSSMEVTSFVHPKAIPQLKDAEEVVQAVQDISTMKMRALVPNVKGAERAIGAGIKKLKLMLSATDSHSLSNANATVEEAQKKLEPIADLAEKENVTIGGSISVAFGCPYEGRVTEKQLYPILKRYQQMNIQEVSLADTTGMANPKQVHLMLQHLQAAFPDITFSMHLHNTRGLALANMAAGMEQGIRRFDSSTAGLGGCPYAPGATGNVPTEDVVHMMEEMGIATDINLEKIIDTAKEVKNIIGHDGGSYMLQAGPNSQLHDKVGSQKKVN
ncbi:hydroxymethylglutaryl-CoA lyase [Marinococcus sp. PL1-022]|uniref:hydroxymethylglutaryl-CoA lyase n=1 Tax=Marinococcus sp. PL1-022 TaxID=3095363 RepID=UPI0029C420C0|nr:hydroxymethylglutaryl-CoA lyase [Marinococcus sp. PL1-022]MDX6151537.1 hydroxymethylglutaryl-CoA lyase [Marinococcus sp. PL1-022]